VAAVRIHLWGELGFYGPGKQGRFEVEVRDGTPVLELLGRLGVPWSDVAVAGLNGEIVRLDDPAITVSDEDRLDLFPPSSGG
jgi:sulfur carrier protein ThiS